MKLLSPLLSAGIFATYIGLFCQSAPAEGELLGLTKTNGRILDDGIKTADENKGPTKIIEGLIRNPNKDGEEEDYLDADFEDEDDNQDLMNLSDSEITNINSIMHLQRKKGEILVSCFGMWWPVGGTGGGGGSVYYDYTEGDYYDDYRKKRRRARKQKKAARMKKKRAKAKAKAKA